MKVLITGGCGFIGSHVCDRFYREGHEVFIIDNLSTGSRDNVQHKHRLYEMNIEDPQIEEVFKNNRFDAIIHLAAQVDRLFATRHPNADARTNVLGTLNLLNAATKYKNKRFIFISSEEVYSLSNPTPIGERNEKNPPTMLGLEKLIGETYCSKWRTLRHLDTTILRLGSVYGPRQKADSQGIPVSKWISQLLKGTEVHVAGDPERHVDLIYVEDVAAAIYNVANIKLYETMNICGNQPIEMAQVFSALEGRVDTTLVKYHHGSVEPYYGRHLDNTLAKRLLDWQPLTDINKGMLKTLEWYADHQEAQAKAKASAKQQEYNQEILNKKAGRAKWRTPLLRALEALIAFGLVFAYKLNYFQQHTTEPFDLGLVFIIVFSILYGSKQGIAAILLSALATFGAHVLSGREPLMLFYQSEFFMNLAFYVFVGFIIGYVRDNREQRLEANENQIRVLEEKLDFATILYQDMREIRDELQHQIVNSEDSFGKIFSVVQTLDTLSPDEVFAKAIQVIERLMKTDAVAIFKFGEDSRYARLMANSAKLSSVISKSIHIEEHPEIQYIQKRHELFVSRQVGEGQPIMAMPVFDKNTIIGSIVLYRSDFERLTLSYQNYFKVITNLVATSLMKAYAYDAAIEMDRYIDGTDALKPERFMELLESKQRLLEENQVAFSLLHVPNAKQDLARIAQLASSILRDTDAIGLHPSGEVYVLLGNTQNDESIFVVKRLEQLGIFTELVQEVG